MTQTLSPATVRFPRLARRGLLLGLSGVQVGCVGAGLGLLVIAVVLAGVVGLVLVSPLVVALEVGAVVRIGGHPGVVWAVRWLSFERRRAESQTRWRARPAKPIPEGSLGLPGTAASLRVFSSPDGPAVVLDAHANTMTAVVRVSTPAFVLLDTAEQ